MNRNSHFQRGSGRFTCTSCGRGTRATGVQGIGAEVCPDCWELAGIYNVHQDGGDLSAYAGEIQMLCESIVSKGGKLDSDARTLLELTGQAVPA